MATVITVTLLIAWGALLLNSANSYATVTSVQRHIEKRMTDIHGRDCFITAKTSDGKNVSGYGPASYCSSVSIGDKVIIKDGIVTQKRN